MQDRGAVSRGMNVMDSGQSGRESTTEAKLRTLGQGLMRLAREGTGALPPPQGAARRLTLAQSAESAGVAFSQLIAAMTSRTTVWGSPLLTSAAERLGTQAAGIPDAFFYTDLHTMNLVSHAIEERAIAQRLDCEVYAGFQRLSLLKPQLPRYRALLQHARQVCVYGLDDTASAPEVAPMLQHPKVMRFTIDRRLQTGLEWFWFVVVDHPQLCTALLAQHTDGDLFAPRQSHRGYVGLWTFDAPLVREIVASLRQAGRTLYYRQ